MENSWKLQRFIARPSFGLCRTCHAALLRTRRRYASAASAIKAHLIPEITQSSHQAQSKHSNAPHAKIFTIESAVLLSRPPVLTRELSPFEKAHFLYQRRLNERLAIPFSRYFYYQKGTPGDVEWKRKIKQRLSPSRDVGKYSGYGADSWNDEALVGEHVDEPDGYLQALITDAEDKEGRGIGTRIAQSDLVDKPMERKSAADEAGDTRSLSRLLTRSLYLVVKSKDKRPSRTAWSFPTAPLEGRESLHMAAERIIVQSGGINMNTWVIGHVPACHQQLRTPTPGTSLDERSPTIGPKIFYMTARMLAGRVDLTDNKRRLDDYQWLCKEELQKVIHESEYSAVRAALSGR